MKNSSLAQILKQQYYIYNRQDFSPTKLQSRRQIKIEKEYKRFEEVEARLKGNHQWYPGKISKVNKNGTYIINFHFKKKGKIIQKTLGTNIRKRINSDEIDTYNKLKVGDKVEALWIPDKRWYCGQIKSINNDDTLKIYFDDGFWQKRTPVKITRKFVDYVKGERIEAKFFYKTREIWYAAVIKKTNKNGTYDVKFEDDSIQKDQKIKEMRRFDKKYLKIKSSILSPKKSPKRGLRVNTKQSKITRYFQQNKQKLKGQSQNLVSPVKTRSRSRSYASKSKTTQKKLSFKNKSKSKKSKKVKTQNRYKVNQIIDVCWEKDQKWYKARVISIPRNNKYNIEFPDQLEQRNVKERDIRPFKPYKAGEIVQAVWSGNRKWYPAKILKQNKSNSLKVQFLDDNRIQNFTLQLKLRRMNMKQLKTFLKKSKNTAICKRLEKQISLEEILLEKYQGKKVSNKQSSKSKRSSRVRKGNTYICINCKKPSLIIGNHSMWRKRDIFVCSMKIGGKCYSY